MFVPLRHSQRPQTDGARGWVTLAREAAVLKVDHAQREVAGVLPNGQAKQGDLRKLIFRVTAL